MTPGLPKTVVYVHGAGEQENPILLKRRLDQALFGAPQGERTRMAYYADQGHNVPEVPAGLEAMPRPDPFRLAEDPHTPPEEIARALAMPGPGAGEVDARVALAESLLARADALEPPRAAAGGLERAGFWDPGFRVLVAILARDVIRYLFDGQADAMREPLRQALATLEHETLLIAHSLGTIVAFDVVSDPDYAGPARIHLVTLGSPLGIANVQERLRDGAGSPHPIPRPVATWRNFADPRDPVASGQPLADEYDPHGRIEDDFSVENSSLLHHDLIEYLRSPHVRAALEIG